MKKLLLLIEVILCFLPLIMVWLGGVVFTSVFIYLSLTEEIFSTSLDIKNMFMTLIGLFGIIGIISAIFSIFKGTKPKKWIGYTTASLILIGVLLTFSIGLNVKNMGELLIFSALPILASIHVSVRYFQLINNDL